MSQSHNPPDTQAVLQSMLQRLKLQSGREGHAHLHTPAPNTAASTWGQEGARGASTLQKVNNSPVNGFQFGTNGAASKQFGISAANSNFSLRGGEIQQPSHGSEVDRSLTSFPTQKDNVDGDTGENSVLGLATRPGVTPTGTGQLFPPKSLKDADTASFERTDGKMVIFGRHTPSDKDALTSTGPDQGRGFTPKVYTSDSNISMGSQEDQGLHMGNGGFGALTENKDMQTNSNSRRKARPSENKARRWTQRIKERWRDRQGSIGKKRNEEGERAEQGLQTAETLINTSVTEEDRTLSPQDNNDRNTVSPPQTGDSTNEGSMRPAGDFEFGLGSFSLLDEIVTGQEWAKFLNPNLTAAGANQRPSEEPLSQLKVPPNPHNSQSGVIVNQQVGVSNQWSFRGTEASPVSDVSMGPSGRDAHREADHSEPMEDGHVQSDMQSKPADIQSISAPKSRVHLNRKRQHQSAESADENMSDGKEADREGSRSSLRHTMEATGASQHDNIIPLYTLNSSPQPLSPSSCTPSRHAPKSVLKHSISQDSESLMEVMTKRRRVEENRRVRFSEEVVAIAPAEQDMDASDSEEDSGAEEDSVIEEECEVEQAAVEEVAPARRSTLPAWILALKRKNTGRKQR